jgi:hypothetical protein
MDAEGDAPARPGRGGRTLEEAGVALRTPRAAAVAGIVFSVLVLGELTVLNLSVPRNPDEIGAWITDPSRRNAVVVALNLVPFAGLAFLWFIGVLRDRIGDREDRFFATVFLGSGLLFVAMLFGAAAVAGGLIASVTSKAPLDADVLSSARHTTALLMHVYAMRMAGVFIVATATISIRTGAVPRWIAVTGFVVGIVLLVSVGLSPWVELLFPAWILLVSVEILRLSLRGPDATDRRPAAAT